MKDLGKNKLIEVLDDKAKSEILKKEKTNSEVIDRPTESEVLSDINNSKLIEKL